MSKVITFSRVFPAYHPKAGQPTFFVEKILNSLGIDFREQQYYNDMLIRLNEKKINERVLNLIDLHRFVYSLHPYTEESKPHTIRGGKARKIGDKFSPRIWSDIPNKKNGRVGAYHSPQIIFAPDIEIKKVWDFDIKLDSDVKFLVDKIEVSVYSEYMQQWVGHEVIKTIAKNDGLDSTDLLNWFEFPQPFTGQIICWDETINY